LTVGANVLQGQVVDTPAANEFLQEILQRTSLEQLAAVGDDLARKTGALRELMVDRRTDLSEPELRQVLRWCFASRRKADRILATVEPVDLSRALLGLFDDAVDLDERFRAVDAVLADWPGAAFDLPGELLHFVRPDQNWLWTRWVWDPAAETGALRLVTMDEVDLAGRSRADTYLAVGGAVAFVEENGKAAGFTTMAPGLYGTDIYLAGVYGVYMYTVLRMRMTAEFNKIVPPLGELVRRLLGVQYREV
jgi:hypothetical protein